MTPVSSFEGKRVALFGLGGSGFATARALTAGGADVVAWDDNPLARARAGNAGINVGDLDGQDWRDFSSLILAPGVPLTHPAPHWSVVKAREAGIEIIGDIELFSRERALRAPDAPFIAITGTNGKSTTTALIGHILEEAGMDVQIGGNLGTPILELEPPAANRIHVIECSSFQIDLAPTLKPTVGILLNISPDHIDRHGSMANYAAVKEQLVANADMAIVSVDDEPCWTIGHRRMESARAGADPRATIPVSGTRALKAGVFVRGAEIISTVHEPEGEVVARIDNIPSLRGAHNAQNAAFAAACTGLWHFPYGTLQHGLNTFPGLPHRLEEVGRLGNILFINDSKATNADAAEKALRAFENIYWIAGGQSKEGGIKSLLPLAGRIRKTYLIGAATDYFASQLDGTGEFEKCGTLDAALAKAVEDAHADMLPEAVVLLSPACASYDQYANYEARGDVFRDLVTRLIEATETV